MPLRADDLPDDVDELKRLVIERDVELAAAKSGLIAKTLEAEKLKFELARLRRLSFGQSSERILREIAQLELKLEEIETAAADTEPAGTVPAAGPQPVPAPAEPAQKTPRRKLPDHLPRRSETHEPASCACPRCGTQRMRKVGEDVTEILEYIPGRFEVVRHVRPAYSCAKCEAMAQAPMPTLPIPRGLADASVISHIVMSKYADHLPLYRQAEIYARDGVDLDRALLADWVGKAAWLVRPLADRIAAHVMAGSVIHADDTPVPVLAPGNGKTKTGRLWVYLRDERPHSGPAPPAVLYRYAGLQGRALPRASGAVRGLPARRWLRRLRRALRKRRGQARRHRSRLLGARAAQVLRRAQGERVTDCQAGARSDRRPVRHRARHCRQAA